MPDAQTTLISLPSAERINQITQFRTPAVPVIELFGRRLRDHADEQFTPPQVVNLFRKLLSEVCIEAELTILRADWDDIRPLLQELITNNRANYSRPAVAWVMEQLDLRAAA